MKAYLYIDQKNLVVYLNDEDSAINRKNERLRRYELHPDFVGAFIWYYRLRIHPKSKKNIIK